LFSVEATAVWITGIAGQKRWLKPVRRASTAFVERQLSHTLRQERHSHKLTMNFLLYGQGVLDFWLWHTAEPDIDFIVLGKSNGKAASWAGGSGSSHLASFATG
jgi:hypothetical protein